MLTSPVTCLEPLAGPLPGLTSKHSRDFPEEGGNMPQLLPLQRDVTYSEAVQSGLGITIFLCFLRPGLDHHLNASILCFLSPPFTHTYAPNGAVFQLSCVD